ncbi:MAG: lactonase family protein, partial [Steroidobacterales bacterium]
MGGTVSGLTGTNVVLQTNGANTVSITANGTYTFATLPSGSAYAVTIMTQPSNPAQTCTVTNGSGTLSANVTNVSISCVTNLVTVGGTISGPLTGTGLVVTDSVSGATATVAANATTFSLSPMVNSGSSYNISVTAQPSGPTENCSVTSGGTGTATTNVNSVVVTCAISTFTVGGTLAGDAVGTGLVVKDTISGSTKSVAPNATSFAITPAVNSGASYNVIVTGQPTSPVQSCVVTSGGSGTVTTGNVTSVLITCTTTPFTIGGTLTGLNGNSVTLTDSVSGHTKTVSANGAYTFTQQVKSGTNYAVTVATQPTGPAQFCTVTAGSGTVTNATVSNINVSCKNTGKFVFVANPVDNSNVGSVAAFTIDPTSGALTAATGSPYAETGTDTNPTGLALDPGGAFLYVANAGSADVSTYGIGPGGVLTPDVQTPASSGASTNQPLSLAIDPTGPYLYVGSNDTPNGTLEAYTVSNTGVLAPVTGVLSTSTYASGNEPFTLAVDSTNSFLYAPNVFDNAIVGNTINAGGTLTALGSSPVTLANAYAVAAYPTGQFVYVTDAPTPTPT